MRPFFREVHQRDGVLAEQVARGHGLLPAVRLVQAVEVRVLGLGGAGVAAFVPLVGLQPIVCSRAAALSVVLGDLFLEGLEFYLAPVVRGEHDFVFGGAVEEVQRGAVVSGGVGESVRGDAEGAAREEGAGQAPRECGLARKDEIR